MYVKPEVTNYSGKELLDLMGPVETAYDCDLTGDQGTGDGQSYIEYTLQVPEGSELDDFDGTYFHLDGPCAERTGTCGEGIGDDCILESGEEGLTYIEFGINICEVSEEPCDPTGNWTLETQLIEDGKRLPPGCESTDYFVN
jgi:hypothetical protein